MHNPPPYPSPPRPPYGPTSGGSDAFLAGELRTVERRRAAYPEAALMERHWEAVCDYVALFVPRAGKTVSMAAAAAFGLGLERLREDTGGAGGAGGGEAGPAAGALRVHFLGAARQVLRDWAADARIAALLTGIQYPEEPAENRRLIARAFRALPAPAQVLLWHREVEAEGLSIPCALLAVDPRGAAARLAEARELLRAGCLSAHQQLAPDPECRHYGRLLDISLRRTGPLIPDIQRHLAACRHCRHAAEQLLHSDGRLALLLAEGLLGGGAERYLASRPGRARVRDQAQPAPKRPGRHSRGGRRRVAATGGGRVLRLAAPALDGLRAGALRLGGARAGAAGGAGAGTADAGVAGAAAGGRAAGSAASVAAGRGAPLFVSLGIVVTGVLVAAAVTALVDGGDAGDGGTGHRAGAQPGGAVTVPAPPAPAPAGHPTGRPSDLPTQVPAGPIDFRLRNAGSGLCLDLQDGRAVAGTELTLAACTAGPVTQLWTYEEDGLLRSAADPTLCAHSHRPAGTVVLAACTADTAPDAADVRYDITLQGVVVPRWSEQLALTPVTPGAGSSVVVRVRDGAAAQRWTTEAPEAAVPGTPPGRMPGTAPRRAPAPTKAAHRPAPRTGTPSPEPAASPGGVPGPAGGPESGTAPAPEPHDAPPQAPGGAPQQETAGAPPGGPGDASGEGPAGEARPRHFRDHERRHPAPGAPAPDAPATREAGPDQPLALLSA
ncbi:ricin-type beta-trefoil lectin domain protein [Streptomyces sp. NPDC013953]|uniref:ricin-type beta-trefoil lectin domain protein n=1 Tax=Streptomyces sp. NPDC013953 TaxID=3364868 RepID=UPI0036F72217